MVFRLFMDTMKHYGPDLAEKGVELANNYKQQHDHAIEESKAAIKRNDAQNLKAIHERMVLMQKIRFKMFKDNIRMMDDYKRRVEEIQKYIERIEEEGAEHQ